MRDALVLGLLLVIVTIGPLATGAVRLQDFFWVQALTSLTTVVWLARWWRRPDASPRWTPICWCVTAFVVYGVVRWQTAPLAYVARHELMRVFVYALLFFIAYDLLAGDRYAEWVFRGLTLVAAGIALYAVWQFLVDSDRVWHFRRPDQYAGRASGTYINPNHLAGYLGMVLPVALAGAVTGTRCRSWTAASSFAVVALWAGIGCSQSRAGWLAASIASTVLLGWLAKRGPWHLRALGWGVGLAMSAWIFVLQSESSRHRWQGTVAGGELSDVRLDVWKSAVQMWREALWTGVGPGHFGHRFTVYRPEHVQMRPDRVHNDYLNTLVDWGLIGFGLAGCGAGCLGCGILRAARRPAHAGAREAVPSCDTLRWGAAAGLLALAVHSGFDFNLHVPANAIVATVLAAAVAHLRPAQQGAEVATARRAAASLSVGRAQLILAAVTFVAATILSIEGYRNLREQSPLRAAELAEQESRRLSAALHRLDPSSPERAAVAHRLLELDAQARAALEQAYEADPTNFETTHRLGEAWRSLAWQGHTGFEQAAEEAMKWFCKGMTLNPWHADNYLGYGMCLHWIRRYGETQPYFDKGLALDPNGAYTSARVGWHYLNLSRPTEAKNWFERSLRLKPHRRPEDNPFASYYLQRLKDRQATPVPEP